MLYQKKNIKHLNLNSKQAWRLGGGRIVDFCNGRNIILLQTIRPVPRKAFDPVFNEISIDENDIYH